MLEEHRHRAQRTSDSRDERRVDGWVALGSTLDFAHGHDDVDACAHDEGWIRVSNIESQFQFLGSTEITYNSITDFIDNRPAAVQVALDSPVFTPQQYYLIGFMQDSWRATDRDARPWPPLRFLLGGKGEGRTRETLLRRGQRVQHRPGRLLQSRQEQFLAAPVGDVCNRSLTALRAGFGLFYGPGQFEDRIQPIENYIERRRVQAADIPSNGLAYPFDPSIYRNLPLSGYTRPAGRVQHAVRRERVS